MKFFSIKDVDGNFGCAAIILAIGISVALLALSFGGYQALQNSHIKVDINKPIEIK
jgi:hypothetical protein